RRLARLDRQVHDVHWAPDGHSLTLLQDRGEADSEFVAVAVADGRVVRRVPCRSLCRPIAWSPDGRRLAFAPYGRRSRIWVIGADGRNRRLLADGSDAAWAPDGRTIAYITDRGDLASIRPDGTGRRRLTSEYPNGMAPLSPAWIQVPITPAPSPHRIVASPRPHGAVLHTYFPVARLAAAGTRVALVSPEHVYVPSWISTPPLLVWDARSGRVDRVSLAAC